MKKYYYNNRYQKSDKDIQYKSSASYLYQKFLGIDKRMRLNIVIGVSMLTIVFVTGFVLAMISLFQFGGSLIDDAFGENNVENALLHVEKKIIKKVD